MVKANELRIGNKLIYSDDERIKPHLRGTILTVTADDILFLSQNDVNHVRPIPITEEWLRNLGFNIQHKNVFVKGIYDIEPLFEESWEFCIHERQTGTLIKYVHELQNLYFALTGEELEVKRMDWEIALDDQLRHADEILASRNQAFETMLYCQLCYIEQRVNIYLPKWKYALAKMLEQGRESMGLPRLSYYPIHQTSYTFYSPI